MKPKTSDPTETTMVNLKENTNEDPKNYANVNVVQILVASSQAAVWGVSSKMIRSNLRL